ncbi:hypothetical protein QBA57_28705 [Streptomyces scabiei]|uniref:hypothetical protein n=1 Tax=Streptomyces scabiei TaxID=1930 RepID=UPI001B33A46B|nr:MULTISPECIES: hypothetical protein [Streptomyces]MBP5883151.1 hypothetical protein [Streptomyces sp. LBUM 1487]MDX2628607.1 hypothetical protein [Streptomyces scabiei]MDX3162727.1 hypothetical protein [Streptomyces scabiei]
MTAARILGVTIAAGPLLAVLLALAVGWVIGHSTARVKVIPIGAILADDEAALLAHERARWEDLVAQLDVPDDLKRPE